MCEEHHPLLLQNLQNQANRESFCEFLWQESMFFRGKNQTLCGFVSSGNERGNVKRSGIMERRRLVLWKFFLHFQFCLMYVKSVNYQTIYIQSAKNYNHHNRRLNSRQWQIFQGKLFLLISWKSLPVHLLKLWRNRWNLSDSARFKTTAGVWLFYCEIATM